VQPRQAAARAQQPSDGACMNNTTANMLSVQRCVHVNVKRVCMCASNAKCAPRMASMWCC
jgi:hypothetical protein